MSERTFLVLILVHNEMVLMILSRLIMLDSDSLKMVAQIRILT